MKKHGLHKDERLHGKNSIDRVFHEGISVYRYPIKAFALKIDNENGLSSMLTSVSKRYFKKAVDRNLLKRRMREAYRLNKDLLSQSADSSWHIAFLYTSKEIENYKQINIAVTDILRTLDNK
ncbi:MAG: ribonuclease P protein component [Bacteroidales bacterium]